MVQFVLTASFFTIPAKAGISKIFKRTERNDERNEQKLIFRLYLFRLEGEIAVAELAGHRDLAVHSRFLAVVFREHLQDILQLLRGTAASFGQFL